MIISLRTTIVVATLCSDLCCAGSPWRGIGYFWHVTDFHFDPTYETIRLSCSDEVSVKGKYGDYLCGSPWKLVNWSINAMGLTKNDVDFLIWTGDNVAHIPDDKTSMEINLATMKKITDELKRVFHGKTVYASLGNRDFHPHDQAPSSPNEFYRRVAEMWEPWIRSVGTGDESSKNVELFKKGGYYRGYVNSKLSVMVLNTNLYYIGNKLTENIEDPAGQFAWLKTELRVARWWKRKMILVGHVPVGLLSPGLVDWFHPRHSRQLLDIMYEFSDVISGSHFGHNHMDAFQLLEDTLPRVCPDILKRHLSTTQCIGKCASLADSYTCIHGIEIGKTGIAMSGHDDYHSRVNSLVECKKKCNDASKSYKPDGGIFTTLSLEYTYSRCTCSESAPGAYGVGLDFSGQHMLCVRNCLNGDSAPPRAVAQFTAPSVTPWKPKSGVSHNPGIRLVKYDRETGRMLDYDQYFINLTESNDWTKRRDFTVLYTFTSAYGVPDMSPSSVRQAFARMESQQSPEAQKYCNNHVLSATDKPCTPVMRAEIFCGGLNPVLETAKDCVTKFLTRQSKSHAVGQARASIATPAKASIITTVLIMFVFQMVLYRNLIQM